MMMQERTEPTVLQTVDMKENRPGLADSLAYSLGNHILSAVMQRCLRPVFVSCKNGIVTTDELYKLNTVAKKFGGKYSRAAIVICQRQNKQSLESLKKRADSMDIRVIEVYNLSEKKLAEKIANLGAG